MCSISTRVLSIFAESVFQANRIRFASPVFRAFLSSMTPDVGNHGSLLDLLRHFHDWPNGSGHNGLIYVLHHESTIRELSATVGYMCI